MNTEEPFSVSIQTEASPIPSVPAWFGEVALVAHTLTRQGVLSKISDEVRFARKRFGTFEVIDFVVVLMGYAISGEPTLAAYYERLLPFATPFMALFGRSQVPARSTLSRFLAALDQASVEALRGVFAARMRWLARDPRRAWEVCGIGEGNDGWSSIWTAPDRPHDSVRCLRVRICPLHSGGCKRSVRLATRGASGGKSCACLSRLRAHRPVNHVHNEGTSSLRSHDVGRCVEPGLQRNGTRSAGRATWGPIRRFRLPGPLGTPPRVCHPLAPVGGLLTSSVPYLRGFSSEARWSYK